MIERADATKIQMARERSRPTQGDHDRRSSQSRVEVTSAGIQLSMVFFAGILTWKCEGESHPAAEHVGLIDEWARGTVLPTAVSKSTSLFGGGRKSQ